MATSSDAITDSQGRVMFHCPVCGSPITRDDFFELGLRTPEGGESREEYCERELIDTIEHTACLRAARAG